MKYLMQHGNTEISISSRKTQEKQNQWSQLDHYCIPLSASIAMQGTMLGHEYNIQSSFKA